jgi:hypothetical protein
MATVICAHGVGVDPTSRGLFTDICPADATLLTLTEPYRGADGEGCSPLPLTVQTQMVEQACRVVDGPVLLVGHSLGALAVLHAAVDAKKLLLAMPWLSARESLLRRWPHLRCDQWTSVRRSSGDRSWFGPAFWSDELANSTPAAQLAEQPDVISVWPGDDPLLGRAPKRLGGLRVPGADHDFKPDGRRELRALIAALA